MIAKFPHIRDYRAYRVPPHLDVKQLLKCQLAVAAFDCKLAFTVILCRNFFFFISHFMVNNGLFRPISTDRKCKQSINIRAFNVIFSLPIIFGMYLLLCVTQLMENAAMLLVCSYLESWMSCSHIVVLLVWFIQVKLYRFSSGHPLRKYVKSSDISDEN